jgi:hypothetical protein
MKIDFSQLGFGTNLAPFRQDGVTLKSWDELDNSLIEYVIESGKGYSTSYRTECTLPYSDPVTISILVSQPVTVWAYNAAGAQVSGPHQLDIGIDCQPVPLAGSVAKVEIRARDRGLFDAYVCTLEWTPIVKKGAGTKRP